MTAGYGHAEHKRRYEATYVVLSGSFGGFMARTSRPELVLEFAQWLAEQVDPWNVSVYADGHAWHWFKPLRGPK